MPSAVIPVAPVSQLTPSERASIGLPPIQETSQIPIYQQMLNQQQQQQVYSEGPRITTLPTIQKIETPTRIENKTPAFLQMISKINSQPVTMKTGEVKYIPTQTFKPIRITPTVEETTKYISSVVKQPSPTKQQPIPPFLLPPLNIETKTPSSLSSVPKITKFEKPIELTPKSKLKLTAEESPFYKLNETSQNISITPLSTKSALPPEYSTILTTVIPEVTGEAQKLENTAIDPRTNEIKYFEDAKTIPKSYIKINDIQESDIQQRIDDRNKLINDLQIAEAKIGKSKTVVDWNKNVYSYSAKVDTNLAKIKDINGFMEAYAKATKPYTDITQKYSSQLETYKKFQPIISEKFQKVQESQIAERKAAFTLQDIDSFFSNIFTKISKIGTIQEQLKTGKITVSEANEQIKSLNQPQERDYLTETNVPILGGAIDILNPSYWKAKSQLTKSISELEPYTPIEFKPFLTTKGFGPEISATSKVAKTTKSFLESIGEGLFLKTPLTQGIVAAKIISEKTISGGEELYNITINGKSKIATTLSPFEQSGIQFGPLDVGKSVLLSLGGSAELIKQDILASGKKILTSLPYRMEGVMSKLTQQDINEYNKKIEAMKQAAIEKKDYYNPEVEKYFRPIGYASDGKPLYLKSTLDQWTRLPDKDKQRIVNDYIAYKSFGFDVAGRTPAERAARIYKTETDAGAALRTTMDITFKQPEYRKLTGLGLAAYSYPLTGAAGLTGTAAELATFVGLSETGVLKPVEQTVTGIGLGTGGFVGEKIGKFISPRYEASGERIGAALGSASTFMVFPKQRMELAMATGLSTSDIQENPIAALSSIGVAGLFTTGSALGSYLGGKVLASERVAKSLATPVSKLDYLGGLAKVGTVKASGLATKGVFLAGYVGPTIMEAAYAKNMEEVTKQAEQFNKEMAYFGAGSKIAGAIPRVASWQEKGTYSEPQYESQGGFLGFDKIQARIFDGQKLGKRATQLNQIQRDEPRTANLGRIRRVEDFFKSVGEKLLIKIAPSTARPSETLVRATFEQLTDKLINVRSGPLKGLMDTYSILRQKQTMVGEGKSKIKLTESQEYAKGLVPILSKYKDIMYLSGGMGIKTTIPSNRARSDFDLHIQVLFKRLSRDPAKAAIQKQKILKKAEQGRKEIKEYTEKFYQNKGAKVQTKLDERYNILTIKANGKSVVDVIKDPVPGESRYFKQKEVRMVKVSDTNLESIAGKKVRVLDPYKQYLQKQNIIKEIKSITERKGTPEQINELKLKIEKQKANLLEKLEAKQIQKQEKIDELKNDIYQLEFAQKQKQSNSEKITPTEKKLLEKTKNELKIVNDEFRAARIKLKEAKVSYTPKQEQQLKNLQGELSEKQQKTFQTAVEDRNAFLDYMKGMKLPNTQKGWETVVQQTKTFKDLTKKVEEKLLETKQKEYQGQYLDPLEFSKSSGDRLALRELIKTMSKEKIIVYGSAARQLHQDILVRSLKGLPEFNDLDLAGSRVGFSKLITQLKKSGYKEFKVKRHLDKTPYEYKHGDKKNWVEIKPNEKFEPKLKKGEYFIQKTEDGGYNLVFGDVNIQYHLATAALQPTLRAVSAPGSKLFVKTGEGLLTPRTELQLASELKGGFIDLRFKDLSKLYYGFSTLYAQKQVGPTTTINLKQFKGGATEYVKADKIPEVTRPISESIYTNKVNNLQFYTKGKQPSIIIDTMGRTGKINKALVKSKMERFFSEREAKTKPIGRLFDLGGVSIKKVTSTSPVDYLGLVKKGVNPQESVKPYRILLMGKKPGWGGSKILVYENIPTKVKVAELKAAARGTQSTFSEYTKTPAFETFVKTSAILSGLPEAKSFFSPETTTISKKGIIYDKVTGKPIDRIEAVKELKMLYQGKLAPSIASAPKIPKAPIGTRLPEMIRLKQEKLVKGQEILQVKGYKQGFEAPFIKTRAEGYGSPDIIDYGPSISKGYSSVKTEQYVPGTYEPKPEIYVGGGSYKTQPPYKPVPYEQTPYEPVTPYSYGYNKYQPFAPPTKKLGLLGGFGGGGGGGGDFGPGKGFTERKFRILTAEELLGGKPIQKGKEQNPFGISQFGLGTLPSKNKQMSYFNAMNQPLIF